MTNPILENNIVRMLRSCEPEVTSRQIEAALARLEKPVQPKSTAGRSLAAAAALLFICIAGWSFFPKAQVRKEESSAAVGPQESPKQEPAPDVQALISELGSPSVSIREKAETRLVSVGTTALEALDLALYHENPEVRVKARDVAKTIRLDAALAPRVAYVQAAIKIVRARWMARDFKDLEQAIEESFEPFQAIGSHYVPKKVIGDRFVSTNNPGPDAGDMLTPDIVRALDEHGGMVFLEAGTAQEKPAPLKTVRFGKLCIFTLPDRTGWSAYVVLSLDPTAFDDADGYGVPVSVSKDLWADFVQGLTLKIDASRTISVDRIDVAGGTAEYFKRFGNRALKPGDVILKLNRHPVPDIAALKGLLLAPSDPNATEPRSLTVSRNGKVITFRYRTLEEIRKSPPK